MKRGHIVIPRSNNMDRLKENFGSLDFELSQEDVDEISKIDEGKRICGNYAWTFNNDLFA